MRRWLTIAITALAPGAAHAGGVLEELAAGAAPATESAPGSRWISDKLAGIWDLDARSQLRLDLSSTRVYSDATDTSRGDVYLGALSAVYAPDDHWSVRLTGGWSPESTTRATVPVDPQGLFAGALQADAQLRATASSFAFGAGIDYDSAAGDVHALSASLSVGATYFNAQQQITGVQDPSGAGGATLDAAGMRMRCQIEMCSPEVIGALSPQLAQLGQFVVGASVTDTVDGDTDLSLDASYYLYDHDPLQLGYFALATIARSTLGSATGTPLLRNAVTPSVAHRWDRISASASLSYSDYADGRELDVSASLRVQYKLALAGSHRLKLYAKLAAGAHVDASYELTRSGSAGLGAQYTW
jgi:hypothetical protein